MSPRNFARIHFLSVALAAGLSFSPTIAQQATPATETTQTNLALGKQVVSSDPNKSGWEKGLTDGSWRSEKGLTYATGSAPDFPKTVTVDLENPTSIGYVAAGVPSFGSTKTVKVSLSSDNTTFTEVGSYVFSLNKQENHLFSFPATTARYVRLTYADHYEESVNYPNTHAFTTEVAVYAPGAVPTLPKAISKEAADEPAPKYGTGDQIQPNFLSLHESFLKRGKEGPIGVLFLGDSITAAWKNRGATVWEERFTKYNPANFGIGGDRTQHVLWRIQQGELDGINPKVVVLMIGTNNINYPADEIVKGDTKIVSEIRRHLPNTKVLLLGIFPRGANADNPFRAKIKGINAELAKLDDGKTVRYLDFGDKFLDENGNITKEMMPDALHPNPKGYEIWADAIQPLLDEMLKP